MANKANLANSVLFAPLSDSDTELEVYTGDASLFPAAPFYLTISPKNKWSRKSNSEIVLVTDKTGDVFTITRAQKGTTAKEFFDGDLLANGIYKEDLDDLQTAVMQAMMPVGFVVTLGVSTNPATLYGFGTWTRIQGRVVVGVSDSDSDFDLNDTGGAKTHTLTTSEIPSHSHSIPRSWWTNAAAVTGSRVAASSSAMDGTGQDSGVSTGIAGSGGAHNNLQPYIAKYVWERTA